MFAIKKTTKRGQCVAMRCKEVAADLMCPRHEQEWGDAGSPPLTNAAEEPPGSLSVSVPSSLQASLNEARATAQQYLQVVKDMPNDTDEDLATCAEVVNMAKDRVKELDAQRKSVTGPLNAVVKTVNDWFRGPIEFYGSVKEVASGRITERLAARDEEKRAALALIEAGAGDAPAEAFALVQQIQEAPVGVSIRRTLKWRITDPALVPEYLLKKVVDEDKVDMLVRAEGLKLSVAGIEVYEDTTVVAGRSA